MTFVEQNMSKQIKPTEGELEILNILWQRGASTVREVHEELVKKKEAGYTTTLKLMQIMYDKKLLKRDANARSHIFTAAVSQKDAQVQMLDKMIHTAFNGSAASLVMQALGNYKASADELEQIKQYLAEMEGKVKSKK
jgi:BlaI family transcriptional regulator, penicillinase repressor